MNALSAKAVDFIGQPKQMLINGRWEHAVSGKTFPIINPATGEIMAHAAEGDKEDVDKAVKSARQALESKAWANMSPSSRGKLVWLIGDLILKYADELAELEALDNGKPFTVARAADVALAADIFHYMAGWATKLHGLTIPISASGGNFHSYTRLEPVGVVGQIIPWNFPLLMAAWKLALYA
jgi:phenylacetaldehyde dehydrogenase